MDDNIFCKFYPTSLKGAALSWFTQLLSKSLDCFETLVMMFGVQFPTSRPHDLTAITLINIRQEKGESLRMFMDRFEKVALNIRGLNVEVAIHHMVTALWSGPFTDSLRKKLAPNMDGLHQRAAKFMKLDELKEFRSQVRAEENLAKKNDRDWNMQRSKEGPRPSKFSKYIPLNTGRSRILEEVLSVELIPAPRKFPSPPLADQGKQCGYHRNHDHSTKECMTLKDKN